ncbi:hypothetical protein BHE74_00035791 [Ensete ventricosum]|nr:hypothetical protein BHE74_00035791 [Ensete ventricosum]
MASISKLSGPAFTAVSSPPLRSEPKLPVDFRRLGGPVRIPIAPLRLSIRRDRSGRSALVVKSSLQDGNGIPSKRTTLHDLYEQQGQSPWYDNLCRPVTDLLPLIAAGVRGVTSNPTVIIFQKAISSSSAYDEQFSLHAYLSIFVYIHEQIAILVYRQLVTAGKDIESAYWELVVKDIQDACKLFEPIYDQTDGADGYVSVEVSPRLANDTNGTVEAAKYLHKVVDRRNVYIKIPATAECVPSIKQVISFGISVNVTLIFSLPRYEAVIDAYLDGLESSGLSKLSVACGFLNEETNKDAYLFYVGTPQAAVAQATLAYKLYQKKFSGPRWEALVKKGAKKQRLLWASTSVKNPAYPDTLYVDPLIGPDTVSTMPDQALEAFMDHGVVSRTIDSNISEAEGIYSALEKLGIDWNEVGAQLEAEGVESFKKSFDSLLVTLKQKGDSLKALSL